MKNILLDAVDRQLLAALERDGRRSFAELADEVGLSKTPCWKRVRALEASGCIRGYRAVLDPAALGLRLQAFVQVSINFDRHEAFEAAVRAHDAVVSCHATTGSADYLLVVLVPDMEALDDFLRKQIGRLPGVRSFVTSIAMHGIKVDSLLTQACGEAPPPRARRARRERR